MARRDDDDDSEAFEERPRRKPQRPEAVQPAKSRRPSPDEDEEDDERSRRRRPRDDDEDDDRPRRRKGGAMAGIIPYRNGMALTAYYCGMGGLIAILGSIALAAIMAPNVNRVLIFGLMYGVGGICAILAIIFGAVGCVKASRNPEARGTAHAVIGIVLGSLEIIGLILIMLGVLAVAR